MPHQGLRRGLLACAVTVISLVFASALAELVLRWRAIGPLSSAQMSLH